jgi:ribose transport system substrate-binding protein
MARPRSNANPSARPRASRARRRLAAALALLPVLALAACGSSGSSDDSATTSSGGGASQSADVAQAKQVAERYMAEVTQFDGPTSGPEAVPGKRIWMIVCGFATEGCLRPGDASKDAAKDIGWDVNVVDGRFSPDVFNKAIDDAITAGADGIMLQGISEEIVSQAVKRARAAGIPVGSMEGLNTPSADGVNYEVGVHSADAGTALGDYFIWRQDGKVRAHVMGDNEYKVVNTYLGTARRALEACGGCEIVKDSEIQNTDISTRAPELAVTAQRDDPNINTFIGPYDAAVLVPVDALDKAGLLEGLSVGGFDGVTPALKLIRDGKMAATMAAAKEWEVYAAFDNMNRIFAGQKPLGQNAPVRLITQDNIDSIPAGQPWTSAAPYRDAYMAIWNGKG